MSDAMTDIYRDQERDSKYEKYLDELIKYVQQPDGRKKADLLQAAEAVDAVPNGYTSSRTSLYKKLTTTDILKSLRDGDKVAWGKLIATNRDSKTIKKIVEASPFRWRQLITMKVGYHGLEVDVGLCNLNWIEIIRKAEVGDTFIVAVNLTADEAIKVISAK